MIVYSSLEEVEEVPLGYNLFTESDIRKHLVKSSGSLFSDELILLIIDNVFHESEAVELLDTKNSDLLISRFVKGFLSFVLKKSYLEQKTVSDIEISSRFKVLFRDFSIDYGVNDEDGSYYIKMVPKNCCLFDLHAESLVMSFKIDYRLCVN